MILWSDDGRRLVEELNETVVQQKSVLVEIKKLYGIKHVGDEEVISTQIKDLTNNLKKLNEKIGKILGELIVPQTFFQRFLRIPKILKILKKEQGLEPDELEKETLKRVKKREKVKKESVVKENNFAKLANGFFSKSSKKLIKKDYFASLERDLERTNLRYTLSGYVSMILFATLLALIGGLIVFVFFLFFSIEATWPIISIAENISARIGGLVWILIAFPVGAFWIAYTYPSLERKSSEAQIDYELPFATINMAAISGSMINPIKIFEIIISSEEFPHVKRELTKLINEINVYGSDVVNALRNMAETTRSKKMSDWFKGLATTINSGGDLTKFFDTRSESLLFEYKINREKETKTAETFMDLYISIVIAAPMIFMLLLMMMKISGLGITLATSTITLIMVFGVAMINIFFLLFLHFKKKG